MNNSKVHALWASRVSGDNYAGHMLDGGLLFGYRKYNCMWEEWNDLP